MTPRSPLVVASALEVPLSDQVVWIRADLVPGQRYRLRALVEGGEETEDKGALIRFRTIGTGIGGSGVSVSRKVGGHIYLRTGNDLHRTDRVFSVGGRVQDIGLMAWAKRGPVRVKTLVVEQLEAPAGPTDFFLSFDVEAARIRASGDPIDQLVWGRFGGEEYGIPRICTVLEQHGLVGNFMVDFATCATRGEAELQEIVDHLRGRGHEVHLHLHPELLDASLGFLVNGEQVQMDWTPYDLSRSLLELTRDQYLRTAGKPPYVFRAGSYRINEHGVRAAGDIGLTALSNVKPHSIADVAVAGDLVPYREPFRWDNGVVEIPVDVSSPEVGHFTTYLAKYSDAIARKPVRPTFNVVMHSWSLLRRNSEGFHDSFAREYEDRLHQICEHAARHGRARGYAEYLASLPRELPVRGVDEVRIDEAAPRPWCNICGSDGSPTGGGECRSCGSSTVHRQWRYALDEYGDILVGRRVLGVNLTPAEHRAFSRADTDIHTLDTDAADNSYDCVIWLDPGDDPDRVIADVERVLRPGGVLVLADRYFGDGLLPHFIANTMPVIDPVSRATGEIQLLYKPGGHVKAVRPSRVASSVLSLRLRAAYVATRGVRVARGVAKRLLRVS
jgi:hypothetical protein